MTTPVCNIRDTFDFERLRNDGRDGDVDPCLEDNHFTPIPLSDVADVYNENGESISVTFTDRSHVTWYANGFQYKPTKYGGEMFSAYDYSIALTDDLRKTFPPGSLVRITYNDRSVVAKVTDRKPPDRAANPGYQNRSVDMSKAVAYHLGGYELLQHGVVSPVTIESVHLECAQEFSLGETPNFLSECYPQNHYLSLSTDLFKKVPHGKKVSTPDPIEDIGIIRLYIKMLPEIADMNMRAGLEHFVAGDSRPTLQLVLAQQYVPTGNRNKPDTHFYWDLRVSGFANEEDAGRYRQALEAIHPELEIMEAESAWPTRSEETGTVRANIIPYPYRPSDRSEE